MNKPRKLSITDQIEIDLRQSNKKQKAALMVIVLSPNIRAWLAENDPKALQQCREALGLPELTARLFSEVNDFTALHADQP